MKYNPDIHHRRSIRLPHFDYSRNGAYFVTLCTFDRGCYFDQLTRWLAYYPLDQMLIISQEDLRKDLRKVVNKILRFLNLPRYSGFDLNIGKTHSYPPMDPQVRSELSNFFRPFNEQLETLLDRKFNWDRAD